MDRDLFEAAKTAGAVTSRSAEEQLRHWARIGREFENGTALSSRLIRAINRNHNDVVAALRDLFAWTAEFTPAELDAYAAEIEPLVYSASELGAYERLLRAQQEWRETAAAYAMGMRTVEPDVMPAPVPVEPAADDVEALKEAQDAQEAAEMTSTTAASVLGVSRPTLMKIVNEGLLPSHKVGAHHLFKPADVAKLAEVRHADRLDAFAKLRELDEALEKPEYVETDPSIREITRRLNAALGETLVAALAYSNDPQASHGWATEGGLLPPRGAITRLAFAYEQWQKIAAAEGEQVARLWFVGANPRLDNDAPVNAIREGLLEEVDHAAQALVDDSFIG
ncbi:TA system antitoxin ParD family protein [Cryobacterium sp. 10I5]|uniref:TA system antitoxin ParD family protein n=1 Tax=Cryobacterium sp. 10I5 TaxID=3048581 RepID=UPI002B225267|nr:helix-turn-helix domain-containing protein [Cryobacterium sp. 10I5]MEB0265077.1 excisionase family DNA-binding protein [Cryobacterium sp. 10I5]